MPEGRLWTSSFVIISLVNLFVFMGFNMTNTGLPVFVDLLGGDSIQVGLVGTLATGAALVTRPFTGFMVDRYARKGILVAGLAVSCASVALFFVFPLVSAILLFRLIQGIGWGLGSTSTSTIVADLLPKARFAEGMGYFAMTTSLAAAIAPALSILLLENIGSDYMLLVTLAFMIIALVFSLFGKFERSTNVPKTHVAKTHFRLSDLFEKKALLPSLLIFLSNVAFAPIGTFLVLHSTQQGVEGIFIYFVIYAVVNIILRPLIGKSIDRFGFFVPSIVSVVSIAITLALVALAQSLVVFCVAGFFAGVGFGAAMATFQTMAVAPAPPNRRGVATSTFLFGLNGGMAFGSFIGGIIVGAIGYSGMFLSMTIIPVVAIVVILALGPKRLESYRIT